MGLERSIPGGMPVEDTLAAIHAQGAVAIAAHPVKMYWETHVWPNYNVADSAISIGLVLLVIDSFRPRDRETAAPAPSVPSS